MGDPAGIGPEVLLALLKRPPSSVSISVVGDLAWLKLLSRRLRIQPPWSAYHWVDVPNVPLGLKQGKVQAAAGRAARDYLQEAVRRIKLGQADALVTAPVSKEAIVRAGISWIGHTEFLAESFRCQTVMMFITKEFRVSLVTTHVALRELPKIITTSRVKKVLAMTQEALARNFGIRHPRIALAALNPHGGEGGLFGQEEKRILLPAVRAFKGTIAGPLPADSLMEQAHRGLYDAVVALYHDQALIPVKLIGWAEAVNVTLGLPFIRTSPVHGTAFDLAGTGRADSRSMRAAIELAIQLARDRTSGAGFSGRLPAPARPAALTSSPRSFLAFGSEHRAREGFQLPSNPVPLVRPRAS